MRLGGRSIGPFKWDPRQADRLKYYAFRKRINIDEVIQMAVNTFIDADKAAAEEIDKDLQRQYGSGNVPLIRNVHDLRAEDNKIHYVVEDKYADAPLWHPDSGEPMPTWPTDDKSDKQS